MADLSGWFRQMRRADAGTVPWWSAVEEILEGLVRSSTTNANEVRPGAVLPNAEPLYPCANCGHLRTAAEFAPGEALCDLCRTLSNKAGLSTEKVELRRRTPEEREVYYAAKIVALQKEVTEARTAAREVVLKELRGWAAALDEGAEHSGYRFIMRQIDNMLLSGSGPSCALVTSRADRRSPGPMAELLSPPGGPVPAPGEPAGGHFPA